MKVEKSSMLLYAVTDRKCLKGYSLTEAVEIAVKNGVTFVQLREKTADDKTVEELAYELKKITDKYNVPFVIDDRVEVAKKVGADGVHIGQDDMPISQARAILGIDSIIGVTCRSAEQALRAERDGADYIGIGALFETDTKSDTVPMSYETAKKITSSVNIPVVGIAGINSGNITKLKGYGLNGVAVVSAVFGADDVGAAAEKLLALAKTIIE